MENLTSFFVNVANRDGTPKAECEMPKEEYEAYKTKMAALQEIMRENAGLVKCLGVDISLNREIDMPLQDTYEFFAISYHKTGFNPQKSIATSGNFPLTVQAVLKYFGKVVKLEDLIQIANWGDWISKGGGTYWHYIDAISYAYGLRTERISTFKQVEDTMRNGGLALALFTNDLFPQGLGSHLSVITRLDHWDIYMRSTSGETNEVLSPKTFLENCLVLWSITK